jgi:two-component system response regulator YesN
MEYLSLLRISESKKLIREQNYNMTEISNLLYFDNPHYFSRAFKRFTGMTPREYKYSVKND